MERKNYSALNEMEASSRNNAINTTTRESSSSGDIWKVFGASVQCVVQTLIGGNVCVTLWFAFNSTPVSAFQLHVALCVIGYQLLIANGILSLQTSTWSFLSVQARHRVHLVLQITGSVFAITGSSVMIKEKGMKFKSWHSKLALFALILICASLINGLTSLYAVELRRLIPPKVSKISHITLGTAAFALSSVSLALGYNKKIFKKWATSEIATILIFVLASYTVVVITPSCLEIVRILRVSKNAKNKKF